MTLSWKKSANRVMTLLRRQKVKYQSIVRLGGKVGPVYIHVVIGAARTALPGLGPRARAGFSNSARGCRHRELNARAGLMH